jgi:YD repeat-containing protein
MQTHHCFKLHALARAVLVAGLGAASFAAQADSVPPKVRYTEGNSAAVDPATCASIPWSGDEATACSIVPAYLPACDRPVNHRGISSSLDGPGQCHVQWEFSELSSPNQWVHWDNYAAFEQKCPEGTVWMPNDSVCKVVVVSTPDVPRQCPAAGNPIFPMTGAKVQDEDLGMRIGSRALKATYDSRWMIQRSAPPSRNDPTFPLTRPRAFGSLWQSNLHEALLPATGTGALGANGTGVVVTRGGDDWETFSSKNGQYVSDIDPGNVLANAAGTWTLRSGSRLQESAFDSAGVAQQDADAGGGRLSFAYSTASTPASIAPVPGLLITVTDAFGRSIGFTYELPPVGDPVPRVHDITAPDGAVTHVTYDGWGNLAGLGWPDTQARSFSYTDSRFPWALTGVVDELSKNYATFGYAADATAASTEHAGGVEKFAVTYGAAARWTVTDTYNAANDVVNRVLAWQAPSNPVLTGPTGQPANLGVQVVAGMPRMSTRSQPAGAGCAASTSAFNFDARGNVTTEDDFNGNRTCRAYDASRNLETFRLEGLPTTKACPADLSSYVPSPVDAAHPERKTSTLWHPDWALRTREAAPKKITTWVYNGQTDPIATGTASCAPAGATLPDGKPIAVVCTRYEQSTDDASGARNFAPTTIVGTRVWSYTYNLNGQVLSETAPKLSSTDTLSHTTNYTYYTDTSFPDGATGHTVGDLKKVVDPLGNPAQFTSYDKAGRLLSSTDANGAVTTRTYWPRGWIHTITVTPAAGGGSAQTTTYDYWPTGLLHVVTQPDGSTLTYAYDDAHRLTDVTDGAGNTVHYGLDNVGNRTSETVKDASGSLASAIARAYDNLNRLQTVTGAAQ